VRTILRKKDRQKNVGEKYDDSSSRPRHAIIRPEHLTDSASEERGEEGKETEQGKKKNQDKEPSSKTSLVGPPEGKETLSNRPRRGIIGGETPRTNRRPWTEQNPKRTMTECPTAETSRQKKLKKDRYLRIKKGG